MAPRARLARLLASVLVAATLAGMSLAQPIRTERITAEAAVAGTVVAGALRGAESADYVIEAEAGQILSVDLLTSNSSLNFNISAQGASEALFVGSTSGAVADVPLPAAGAYVVQVYLMRNAARRGERADYTLGIGLGGPDFADGLAGGPDWWAVAGVGGGDALNIRSGPSTRYAVISKARNGEIMQNRGCRMTGPDRWCRIRAYGSGVQGWVAGRYLVETAPPSASEVTEGGPIAGGIRFDATGAVPCATAAGEPTRACPFGVVREGSGNAGVWIALGDGRERQILFEGGRPVASNGAGVPSFERSGDRTLVSVGDERYEIPDAVVFGG